MRDSARTARWRRRAGYRWARVRARFLAWRRRVRGTRLGRVGVKVAVGVLGGAIVVVGLILLPLPAPGWLIIFAGLALLALEFHWARQVLHLTREWLRRWTIMVREG